MPDHEDENATHEIYDVIFLFKITFIPDAQRCSLFTHGGTKAFSFKLTPKYTHTQYTQFGDNMECIMW